MPGASVRRSRHSMQSLPSRARTAAAVALYLIAGVGGMAWKVFRAGITEAGWVPVGIVGVMPNLIPAAFLPMLLFATGRVVRWRDYVGVAVAILGALCAYEVAQIWMPRRTFDWADIAASGAGACVGCLLGWMVFFRWLGSSTRASDSKEPNTRGIGV